MNDGVNSWSLAEAVARAGRVRCGELVALLAPIADALAVAHASGLAYGTVTAVSVRLSAEGTVHLRGEPVEGAEAAADVYSLAVLAAGSLLGALDAPLRTGWAAAAFAQGVPAGLVTALAAALDPHPARRPAAGELATAIRGTCGPLRLTRLLPPLPARAAR
jgi:hypothetical protein